MKDSYGNFHKIKMTLIFFFIQMQVFTWLPAAVFGFVSLMAVFFVLILPETLGRGLPTSPEEILQYPKNLSLQEKRDVREAQRKEDIFGVFNRGFTNRDEEGIKEMNCSTAVPNTESAVTYI